MMMDILAMRDNIEKLIEELKSDDEALAIMSGLGFLAKDWSFIKKVGGPWQLISSDLFKNFFRKKILQPGYQFFSYSSLRVLFDDFYEKGGFLFSPIGHAKHKIFRPKQSPLVFFGYHQSLLTKNCLTVGIVGSRRPGLNALKFSENFAHRLAQADITIVSGGAQGIDQAAQSGALSISRGKAITVLGLALSLHHHQENKVPSKQHAMIFPFGPFNVQGKFMFVERNRYVAALSDALIIVQGKRGSGTLHTVQFAREFNIPIYAVPGCINDDNSFIPNYLLEQKIADPVINVDKFLEDLSEYPNKISKKIKINKNNIKASQLNGPLPDLLQIIQEHKNSLGFDELLQITGKSLPDLQKELLHYELSGQIYKRGRQFVLTGS
jgi:predicted Rossmann fold nucleotide-binding protein DprA/Smf involved in DNA uptake